MAASAVRTATGSSLGGGSSGYLTGIRSPSSSVCSFTGSATSEPMYQNNKYLMKTLCLSKKSPVLPGKAEYANLLTCGLGARKWLASLEFDAESFKAAIVNIYPRLATVPSYSLWNVKPDKALEKLPCMVNTPKRIKAYLGSTFTGSLVIMPSEEISLGPVKVPSMSRNLVNGSSLMPSSVSSSSSRSKERDRERSSSMKTEKESGYESYQEFERNDNFEKSYIASSSTSHKISSHTLGSIGRSGRLICLTCGRLAKQVGSASFYDINNSSTFSTADGYMSIAKKLKDLFHLELPRSKVVPSEQICRKCFRALNEIHFLETQLKRSKEEMMATLLSTISKINRLEYMARDASGNSSSDSNGTTLESLMNISNLNPWIQEARYVLEQKNMQRSEKGHEPQPQTEPPPFVPTTTGAVAIFQTSHSNGDRNYVDYNNPQPVFLAPLAGFAPQGSADHNAGKLNFEKHDAIYKKRSTMAVPLNMSILSNPPNAHSSQRDGRRSSPNRESPPPTSNGNGSAIYLGKSAGPIYFAATAVPNSPRGPKSNGGRSEEQFQKDQEELEKQMAEEELASANEAAEREHSATAFLEEAYRRRNIVIRNGDKNLSGNVSGNGSCSSRGSSIIGNNCSSSPGSQSPSPPAVTSRTPENVTVMVQPNEISTGFADHANEDKNGDDKSSSSNGSSPSPNGVHPMRRPWKKRYHEVLDAESTNPLNDSTRAVDKKRARTGKMDNRISSADHRSASERKERNTVADSSSTDPVSTSSGSPDQEEDLMSEGTVSPKNGANCN